jgi:hypothetical protein
LLTEKYKLFPYLPENPYYYLIADPSNLSNYYKKLDGKEQYFAVFGNLPVSGLFYFTVKIISDIVNKIYVDSEPFSTLIIDSEEPLDKYK